MAEVISRIPTQVSAKNQNQRSSDEPTVVPSRIPRFGEKAPQRHLREDYGENVSSSSLEKHSDEPLPASPSPSTPRQNSSGEEKRTPRYEAFLMTGDKMLNLNPKISPSYAQIRHEQLPPSTQVSDVDTTPKKRGPIEELQQRGDPERFNHEMTVPASQSESILDQHSDGENDENSCMDSEACVSNLQNTVDSTNYSSSTLPENTVHNATGRGTKAEFNKTHSFIVPQFVENGLPNFSPSSQYSRNRVYTADRSTDNVVDTEQLDNSTRVVDTDAVIHTAKQMYELKNFKRATVSKFLMRSDSFAQAVSQDFFGLFNFSGLRIDAALRDFLTHVCLTGESSDRAKLLYFFAGRYFECNPTLFHTPDEIHALTCALILLNTDLHGPNIGKKMSVREFVDNLSHTQYSYERSLLKVLYNAVKSSPFKYLNSEDENPDVSADVPTRASGVFRRLSRKISKKYAHAAIKDEIDYKHGWVVKKSVYDSDGKKTPFGRRNWQMFYATLRGMVLYLHKTEHGFDEGRFNTFNNCILLHHAIATIPTDYKKRVNVFRLRTANFGEILFQTGDPVEVSKWIDAINFVAAAFSTPALPPPAGSDSNSIVFDRPLLPSARSALAMRAQLRSHQDKIFEMEERLTNLRSTAPSIKAKGKQVFDYFYRERYLDNERERYVTYVKILRQQLTSVSQTDLCSRGSSVRGSSARVTTPTAKTTAYITSIPITNNSYHNAPTTAMSTMSSARGNSLRYEGKTSTPSETSSTQQPALAEAMKIASGCLPNVPQCGEAPVYSDEDRISYKKAMHY